MKSLKTKLVLLLLFIPCYTAFFSSSSSSSSSNRHGNFAYTHNKKQLQSLYKKPIHSIQEYKRPLTTSYGEKFNNALNRIGINHRGQLVTYKDGQQFLAHKGPGFGRNSQTVVVDAKYMSNRWSPNGPVIYNDPSKKPVRLGDLVKTGGPNYNVINDNCIQCSKRMKQRFQNG